MKFITKREKLPILLLLLALACISAAAFIPCAARAAQTDGAAAETNPETPDDTPAAPAAVSLSITKSGIQITWEEVPGTKGYYVYRKLNGKSYKKLKKIPSGTHTYTDSEAVEGQTYYYAVKSYIKGKKSPYSSKKKIKYTLPPTFRLAVTGSGASLTWTPRESVGNYHIYRKASTAKSWKLVASTSGKAAAWRDPSPSNGKYYEYQIRSCSGIYESAPSAKKGTLWLKKPSVKLSRSASGSLNVKWGKNTKADGYQVQYSANGLFTSRKTKKISGGSVVSCTVPGLSKAKTYFVRVRSYKKLNGKTYYSPWGLSSNAKNTRTLKASALSTKVKDAETGQLKNKIFELRDKAKLSMYGYDTLQGSCTDGTYGYFAMYNRRVEKCRIVKVHLSTLKVVKVSGVLNIAHGNDLTFNKDKNCIAAVHFTTNPRRITFINAGTLKVSSYKDVVIPPELPGATASQRKAISGFSSIAYEPKSKRYAAVIKGTTNLLVMDKNLNPVSYIQPAVKNPYLNQGLDATQDYIILSQSPRYASQKYNILSVYTWDGTYVKKINAKSGYEIESVFHSGSKFYAGFYRSYYETYYEKEKKTVTENGKKTEKTVKVRKRRLARDNYIYRLSGI